MKEALRVVLAEEALRVVLPVAMVLMEEVRQSRGRMPIYSQEW